MESKIVLCQTYPQNIAILSTEFEPEKQRDFEGAKVMSARDDSNDYSTLKAVFIPLNSSGRSGGDNYQ